MKKTFAVLAVLVLVTLACSFSPVVTPAGEGGGGQQSNILFSDDFSSTNSGWDQFQGDEYLSDYANGGYRIYVNTTQYDAWANPSRSFPGDVRIEVDATKIGGPDDNDFGVICRYQDIDNFYYFLISSDGYAAIGKYEGGSQQLISSDNMQKVDGINPGAATNHIRADCIGSELKLYVNGNLVATATDSSFTSGDVGLMAGTFDTAGTDILFDNFYVYKP
ncbi:MAG: hypothetical protein C0393_06565 [Anaerolinea sp.]|nr:hypothetical protein [Anaerolinea sp.]